MKWIWLVVLLVAVSGCSSKEEDKTVTVYVSEDQVFSEPILKAFEKETGIHVNALYDTEESKSTGVMNRLIAEKKNPRADVYWANEPIRAEVLRQKGLLTPYKSPNSQGIPDIFVQKEYYWTGFSARVRLFLVNDSLKDIQPESILSYTDELFKAKAVIANPLFGTTTAHIAALFTLWGEEKAKQFLEDMKKNEVAISTSNGESADLVAKSEYLFALVDSDDAVSRIRQKKPVYIVYPDQKEDQPGAFVVPNAVMMIKGAPHPTAAKKLIDYLLSKETERKLALADCAQIPLHEGVKTPKELKPMHEIKVMQVDYAEVAKKLVEIQPYLKNWLENK